MTHFLAKDDDDELLGHTPVSPGQQEQTVVGPTQQQQPVVGPTQEQQQPAVLLHQVPLLINLVEGAEALNLGGNGQEALIPVPGNAIIINQQQQVEEANVIIFSLHLQILVYLPTVESLSAADAFAAFTCVFEESAKKVSPAVLEKIFKMSWIYHASTRQMRAASSSVHQNLPQPQTVLLSSTQEEQTLASKLTEDFNKAMLDIVSYIGFGRDGARGFFSKQVTTDKPLDWSGDDRPFLVLLKYIVDPTVTNEAAGLPPVIFDASHIFFPYFMHAFCAAGCNGYVNDTTPVSKLFVNIIRGLLKDHTSNTFLPWAECEEVLNYDLVWFNKRGSFRGLVVSFAFICAALRLVHLWGNITTKSSQWDINPGFMWDVVEYVVYPRFKLFHAAITDKANFQFEDKIAKSCLDKLPLFNKDEVATIKNLSNKFSNSKANFHSYPCVVHNKEHHPEILTFKPNERSQGRIMGSAQKPACWHDQEVVEVANGIPAPPTGPFARLVLGSAVLPFHPGPGPVLGGSPAKFQSNKNSGGTIRTSTPPPPPSTPSNSARSDIKIPDDNHFLPLTRHDWVFARDKFHQRYASDKNLLRQINNIKYLKYHDRPNTNLDPAYNATTHSGWYCASSKKYAPKVNAHKRAEWLTVWGCPYCNYVLFDGNVRTADHAQASCVNWGKF